MKVKISELEEIGKKALTQQGYRSEEAGQILEVLMYAQLRGNNQGLVKLIGKGIPKDPTCGSIKTIKETKLSTMLDGNKTNGMIVLNHAVQLAVAKGKEHGFGIAGTNNTCTSTGAIGYYARKVAEQGLIGFVFSGSGIPTVATHGSYEPLFGTNPLAIGVPSENEPLVLDLATAAMAFYGLIEAKTDGQKIPADIAYDKNGKLTTDPSEAMDGALRTFDKSYKSAHLSLMVEILSGPLVGAAFAGIGQGNWGNLVFAFDPELLTDTGEFKKKVAALCTKVKGVKKLPGVNEVYLPSERGNRLTQERLNSGEIEIEDNLYNELKKAAGL
ncbi:MAG: Ldh family oxidoreductase [Nanoarchaeota archaeon]